MGFFILHSVSIYLLFINTGLCEDGNPMEIGESDRADSLKLWSGREARVTHSVINCAISVKDYELALELLGQLTERYACLFRTCPKTTLSNRV